MPGNRRRRGSSFRAGVDPTGPQPDPGVSGPPQVPGQDAPVDSAVEGCLGVVTIRIPGGDSPGEVRVLVRGTYELFVAYTVEALNVGNRVRVERSRGGRAVDVSSIFTEMVYTGT